MTLFRPGFSRAALALAIAFLVSDVAAQVTLPNVTVKAAEVITLWPAGAPDEKGNVGPERILPDRPRPFDQVENVTVPTLSVFLPPVEKRNGTAVLVIPGGGLERLALEHEGYEVAEWFNAHGVAAFVLKYRVPPRDPQARWKVGVQDAQRSMGLIHARAGEWKLDRDAIGVIGFSAGGEISVMLSVIYNEPRIHPLIDAADKEPTRPAFNIVNYSGAYTNMRERTMQPIVADKINAQTPPTFLAHAFDDGGLAMQSTIFMSALKRAGVVSELHIFGAGGHGFGVRGTGLPLGKWSELCLNWLAWQGFLDSAGARSYARDFAKAQAGGAALPLFSATNRGADLAQAFAAQKRVARQNVKDGNAIAGYVGTFTNTAAKGQPLHGVLFKSGKIEAKADAPAVVKTKGAVSLETEIGYVIATDIGTKLTTPRQALTTVEGIVPVVNLPANDKSAANPVDRVARNLGANQFVVGTVVLPKNVANPDTVAVTLKRGPQTLHTAKAADAAGGQAQALMAIINQLVDQGHVLHRGDIVTSGAIGRVQAGEKGSYTADFGALGTVAFTIE